MKWVISPIIIGGLIILFSYWKGSASYQISETIPDKIEYVEYVVYEPKILVKEKLVAIHDTVIVNDTLFETARAETLQLDDSSSIKVTYYFPPLDYFLIEADIKQKVVYKETTITKYVERKKTFWDRFHYGIQITSGFTTDGKFGTMFGFGITMEID